MCVNLDPDKVQFAASLPQRAHRTTGSDLETVVIGEAREETEL
jgi:hypothetical protein